jgi:hypothetical protein
MSRTHEHAVLKTESLQQRLAQLEHYVHNAAHQGTPIHQAELHIWHQLLHLGHDLLGQFLDLHGTGDQGASLTLPTGQTCERLPELHSRRYVSLFGAFELPRTAYGSRAGQKIDFVPLDNRLQLPEAVFSYVLQDWDQGLGVEQAFGQAQSTSARILNLKQSVDSWERMNGQMAEHVEAFRDNRPRPDPRPEGEILVSSGDGKGIVMRRAEDEPAAAAQRSKGEKASQKRMATVGTVSTVAR